MHIIKLICSALCVSHAYALCIHSDMDLNMNTLILCSSAFRCFNHISIVLMPIWLLYLFSLFLLFIDRHTWCHQCMVEMQTMMISRMIIDVRMFGAHELWVAKAPVISFPMVLYNIHSPALTVWWSYINRARALTCVLSEFLTLLGMMIR